jgi:DNA-binding NarL/FixJ family response regulator
LLADGQPLFSRRLAATLAAQPDMALVAQSSDGDACVRRAAAFNPDVAVVDADLLTEQKTAAASVIVEVSPGTRILLLVADGPVQDNEVSRSNFETIVAAVRSAAA